MEFRRYFALFRRWAWLIVLGAVVAGGTAYLININTRPTYRASARFLIDEAPEGASNEYAQALFEARLAGTYVELIGLLPVLEETINRLDLSTTPEQLQSRLKVSAISESQIIVISVEDSDPGRAAVIANTLGEVFVDLNNQRESERFAESITNYDEQLAELQIALNEVEREIIALGDPDSPEEGARLSQLETTRREAQLSYTESFNNRETLRIEEARNSNNLIPVEPARPPRAPIAPQVERNTLLGIMVGAMLAIGVVLFIEFLDDTIKTPEDVRQVTDITTVGAVAQIKGGNDPHKHLVTLHTPRSPISEAFRVIRTNLSFSAIDEKMQTLVITSSSPGEGKSTITANLAIVMAQTGSRIIIVDSDLRRPTQHQLFKLPNNLGLTSALLDPSSSVEAYLQETVVPGLRILTSGPIPPNPAELLNSQRMETVQNSLTELADVIIFDTPPALTVADATILAPRANGCLLIVDAGQTRQHALRQAVERLNQSNAHIVGIVINQLKIGRGSSYYQDYYRYYNYEYAKKKQSKRLGLRPSTWFGASNRR